MLPRCGVLTIVFCAAAGAEAASVRASLDKGEPKAGLSEPWRQAFVGRMAARKRFLNGGLAPHPDIAGLESRLRAAMPIMAQEAKFEVTPLALSVSYGWKEEPAPWSGYGPRRGRRFFPGDLSQFRLLVTLKNGDGFVPGESALTLQTNTLERKWKARYALRTLENRLVEVWRLDSQGYEEVPWGDKAYMVYERLERAGLAKRRYPLGFYSGPPRTLTRPEFVAPVVALRQGDGETRPLFLNRGAALAVDYLEGRFAAEVYALQKPVYVHPQPALDGTNERRPYQYLAVDFVYGRGVSPVLVSRIKRVIADYAAEQLEKSSVIVMGRRI